MLPDLFAAVFCKAASALRHLLAGIMAASHCDTCGLGIWSPATHCDGCLAQARLSQAVSQRIWPATTWRMVGTALAALLALADQSLETDTGGGDRERSRSRGRGRSRSRSRSRSEGSEDSAAPAPSRPAAAAPAAALGAPGAAAAIAACTAPAPGHGPRHCADPPRFPWRQGRWQTSRMATTGAGAGAIAAPQLRRRTCKPWHEQSCSAGKCHARCLSPLAPERAFLKSSHPQRQQLEHVTWKIRRFACALPMCSGLRLPRAERSPPPPAVPTRAKPLHRNGMRAYHALHHAAPGGQLRLCADCASVRRGILGLRQRGVRPASPTARSLPNAAVRLLPCSVQGCRPFLRRRHRPAFPRRATRPPLSPLRALGIQLQELLMLTCCMLALPSPLPE